MAIHLVRHAKAGSRPDWHQPDDLRPLTSGGLVQAARVAEALAGRDIGRIISSRYVRCIQTVQPLADALALAIEPHPALAEEALFDATWDLVDRAARLPSDTVLCSHGNVIPPVLDRLLRRGIGVEAEERSCHTGSVWTLEVEDGQFVRAVQTLARA